MSVAIRLHPKPFQVGLTVLKAGALVQQRWCRASEPAAGVRRRRGEPGTEQGGAGVVEAAEAGGGVAGPMVAARLVGHVEDDVARPLGVEEAARQAGRKEFFIVGVDGAPKVKARLHDADSLIHATVAQLPDVMAQQAIETGYALMRGKDVPNRVVLIPAELLTRDDPPESTDWGQ